MSADFDPIDALVDMLDAKNPSYTPGVEIARVDAAEAILAIPGASKEAVACAESLLAQVASGRLSGPGAQAKVRACKILALRGAK